MHTVSSDMIQSGRIPESKTEAAVISTALAAIGGNR